MPAVGQGARARRVHSSIVPFTRALSELRDGVPRWASVTMKHARRAGPARGPSLNQPHLIRELVWRGERGYFDAASARHRGMRCALPRALQPHADMRTRSHARTPPYITDHPISPAASGPAPMWTALGEPAVHRAHLHSAARRTAWPRAALSMPARVRPRPSPLAPCAGTGSVLVGRATSLGGSRPHRCYSCSLASRSPWLVRTRHRVKSRSAHPRPTPPTASFAPSCSDA